MNPRGKDHTAVKPPFSRPWSNNGSRRQSSVDTKPLGGQGVVSLRQPVSEVLTALAHTAHGTTHDVCVSEKHDSGGIKPGSRK